MGKKNFNGIVVLIIQLLIEFLMMLLANTFTRKLIIYIIALFESYNDPRISKLGTDFIGTILN